MKDLPAQPKGSTFNLLGVLLTKSKLTEDSLDAVLEGVGLSRVKLWALIHLIQADAPLPLWLLAQRMGCVKSNVTQLVDRLEAEGLVRRIPDPQDRRGVQAEVTEEGHRRYNAGIDLEQYVERELLEGLTPDERKQLYMLLSKLGNRPS